MTKLIRSNSESQTREVAQQIAQRLQKGAILFLEGDLGAGKTVFSKGVAEGLGVEATEVKSPTFVLMHQYDGKLPIYHFDLCRLDSEDQLDDMDTGYFLYGNGVCLVEWADRIKRDKPKEFLEVLIKHLGDHTREIELIAHGDRYQRIVEKVDLK